MSYPRDYYWSSSYCGSSRYVPKPKFRVEVHHTNGETAIYRCVDDVEESETKLTLERSDETIVVMLHSVQSFIITEQ